MSIQEPMIVWRIIREDKTKHKDYPEGIVSYFMCYETDGAGKYYQAKVKIPKHISSPEKLIGRRINVSHGNKVDYNGQLLRASFVGFNNE